MGRGQTIARNSLYLALAHGISKIFSVALTAIAGRVLGPAGYGLYATGGALVEVGRVVASGGLDYLVAREVASNSREGSTVATNAVALKLLTGAVTYGALIAAVLLLDYPRPVLGVVLILGSALFFENMSDVADAVFQGNERMGATTRAFAVGSSVIFAAGAAALLTGHGLLWYCAAFALGYLVRWVIVTSLARRRGLASLSPTFVRRAEMARLMRRGAPLLGATVVSLLFHRVDLLMLGKLVAESDVGLYGAAVRIIDVIVLLPRVLATAVYPAVRRTRDQEGAAATTHLMAGSLRLSLVLCSAAALAVWILAPWALRFILGESFLPATGALRLLSWGVVLQAGSHMMARLLFAIDRESDFLRIGGLSLVCNVTLNALLIPRMGIEGAAWGTVASYALNLALYVWFAARRGYRLPLWRSVAGPLFAVFLAAFVATSSPTQAVRLGVAPEIVLVSAWILILMSTGVLRRADLRRGWQLLRAAMGRGDQGQAQA